MLTVVMLLLLLVDFGIREESWYLGIRFLGIGMIHNDKTGHLWAYRRHDGNFRMTLVYGKKK